MQKLDHKKEFKKRLFHYLVNDIVNKLSVCVYNIICRSIRLAVFLWNSIGPLISFIRTCSKAQIMDHMMEIVEKTRSEPDPIKYKHSVSKIENYLF